MKLDKMVGDRFKEKPTDCVIDSHALMMRGGYMKDTFSSASAPSKSKRISSFLQGWASS